MAKGYNLYYDEKNCAVAVREEDIVNALMKVSVDTKISVTRRED